ncbi:MAG: endonuclease domain-containing protein [Mizugakiibacter sp.]|uniref:endonuclease domain-containing protein n=1 Tax=Mizugakiibacter sp. TaxID=1972610 RepID=UPI00320C8DFD
MTDAERMLWRHLRGRHFQGWKFRRQHPVETYIVDFVCLEARLVIELDGGQHADNADANAARSAKLAEAGFRVLRFWNDAVLTQTDAVLESVFAALGAAPPHPGPLPGGERVAGRSAS